ncbi:MAG: acetyl-CoA hydrolase/transferase family protein [Bacteroidia bacterium]|nr:acetyl-CoA hydrolase/transferase family protein [Bacteroidia bacterium]
MPPTLHTFTSAEQALRHISSGQRVFIHGSAATPTHLVEKLAERAAELKDVELVFISVLGDFPLAEEKYRDHFKLNSLFVSAPVREAINDGRGDYVPVFLSEIPELFKNHVLPIDVALIQVSTPDPHGYCSLGVSVDVARSAVNTAKKVIAQVNPRMPRTHGDGMIHVSEFDAMVAHEAPLHEQIMSLKMSPEEQAIGQHVAGLIENRSTLQMGIGTIPDAVLHALTNHKDLGVHTEMFSDGIIPLIENGTINNRYKRRHPGKTVTGFCLGSEKLYQYIDDNPSFAFLDIDYVNDTKVIRENPSVVAINSCIEIDLTGQVCSDSIGTYQFSGVGGQMDFMRGAALSKGGKPIIALTSRTNKGVARITPFLKQGAGVVTTRAHVHYVVSEYGVAYLFGKNLRQRAKALISIAHPDDREHLEKAFHERFKS